MLFPEGQVCVFLYGQPVNMRRSGGVAVPEEPRAQGKYFVKQGFKLSVRRP